ncbi:MAG: YncE family protein [Elusimicrobia bacterium]|nr:YncE family protein [Elusimicrobiota bacterium]
MKRKLLKTVCFICALASVAAVNAAGPGYRVIKKIKLGGEGRWDYLTVDGAARRLYISRATHVMVVDIEKNKLAGDIPDTPGVHGIAIAPALNRGFTSNGKADSATIFDLTTLKVLGQVKTGGNPDSILFDPATNRVFTFNGKSHDTTVIDASSGTVVATIALGGKPEFPAADGEGRVYVNMEDTSEVVELDSRNLTITKRYPLKPCEEPSGMGFDKKNRRIFSGCDNKIMTVLDANEGKVIAAVPIGEDVDGNAFDPETGFIFSANGDGTFTIAREISPGKFEVVQTVPTRKGTRTMAIDPKTHNIYLPSAKFLPVKADKDGKTPKPQPTKDSFTLLVVGK